MKLIAFCTFFILLTSQCKKLVQIPPPNNSITTSQVFTDSADAAAAISGIYANIITQQGSLGLCNGAQTILCGLSADELVNFNSGSDENELYFNALESNNGEINQFFWMQSYTYIYQTNACIEGLQNSTNLSSTVKNQFLGESKFFRSLFYFYLVNLFGDVPYITSTSWAQTDTINRTNKQIVYENILNDLKAAKMLLRDDYLFSMGKRTRVNKPGAAALLSRVYLYLRDWKDAELEADSIINSNLFSLVDLNNVFSVNSQESILQWQLNTAFGFGTSTDEGISILPSDSTQPPNYYLSSELLSAFESMDQRKVVWLNQSTYSGVTYTYPYKYKNGVSQINLNGNATEYYTVLRLAEQYLIRAEARAQQGNLPGAISDLNVIRNRAGLGSLSDTLTIPQVLTAIAQERRIELFAEWGHRWMDLKRTGEVDSVMNLVTPQKSPGGFWVTYQQLYPIPISEIALNSFLKQNPGYQ